MKFDKILLAYSGGLDTSVILRWLQENYACPVACYTADIGQGEELSSAQDKARKMGVDEIFVENLQERFVRDFVYPAARANAIYEGEYLLGTSLARPLIVEDMVRVARSIGANAIAHGATGKGNDQVRFELGLAALAPEISAIAPWRSWQMKSRGDLMDYAQSHDIPVDFANQSRRAPWSMDANLLHISYEGGQLEDAWQAPPPEMWRLTVAPEQAPDEAEVIEIEFAGGDPVALNGERRDAAAMLGELNRLGGKHGIGRVDIVENRYLGIKSRGCYETPGGTILWKAHRAMESVTLDRESQHLKDSLIARYARLVYDGYWFAPERQMLQTAIDLSQKAVAGTVKLGLYKGNVSVLGRRAPATASLYDANLASFEDGGDGYDQSDATGFINLNALRLRALAKRGKGS